ncbi:MAG TPA: xanthine dehydrogenase family protein subunit M [Rhodospirillales bacterium]|jgi:carbon-monoxide dehydrogenase medium subunit|nr:xanthine dehydrogenase family protein subunit M [Rhodospirillales bacterium]HIM24038.1 xanthine dehydrogenase family protein subunit M [Rhodospirillales bacterium]HIM77563.1 xanthine dehydrogenase family protein subunit M [Rhodospirillales bacterium]
MIPGNFEYHRPATVDEVVALLSEHGDEGRVVAGGHSLIPMMKLRLAAPSHLIDLQELDALKGVSEDGGVIVIGAMVTQAEVLDSGLLADKCPILAETSELIADPQVRNCGTMGGNVANGDPGNDMPAVMMALNASYMLTGPSGERSVAAREFYEAAYFTARKDDELLTSIRIPAPAAGHGYAYAKLKRKVGDYATAAAAVILTMDGDSCASAAIALTNVGQTPLYAEAASQGLEGSTVDSAAIAAAETAAKGIAEPVADMRGSVEYRTEMAGVMTAHAIEAALTRAQGK